MSIWYNSSTLEGCSLFVNIAHTHTHFPKEDKDTSISHASATLSNFHTDPLLIID